MVSPTVGLVSSPVCSHSDADNLRAGDETEERERRQSRGGGAGGGEDNGGAGGGGGDGDGAATIPTPQLASETDRTPPLLVERCDAVASDGSLSGEPATDNLREGEETEVRERRQSRGRGEGGGATSLEAGAGANFEAPSWTPFTEVRSERSKTATSLEAGERDGVPRLESVSDMVRAASGRGCSAAAAAGGTVLAKNSLHPTKNLCISKVR